MGKCPIRIVSRRRAVGLITAGLAAPFIIRSASAQSAWPEQVSVPDVLKGSGEVRVANYGGALMEAEQKAIFEPFEKTTGIKLRAFPTADIIKVKVMVETGNVEWDVIETSPSQIMNLLKTGDYFEKIDYSLVDDRVSKEYRSDYGLGLDVFATVMAYRTDAFNGAAPKSWADFWNSTKFPGDRALFGIGSSGPEMEFALMAAGVSPETVYPIDIDKAMSSYEKIRKSVVKWWTTGAQPVQMLTDREVVMTSVWNGRMAGLQAQGVPVAICWNQGLASYTSLAIPKGAKNKANAMKYIAYATMPIPQARLALAIPYGPVNEGFINYVPPERLAILPTAPEIRKQLLPFDYDWWGANREAAATKFNKWLLG
ncbi:putative spermidine/putrescine transport system substrate-binding protein [Bradyrhizobium sp. LB7.2]